MALTYGFYNSVEGDRKYDAIQMGQIFDGIITDGVYATFLKAMVVKASENASEVIVQPGRCWFNHTWTYIDADYPVEAPAPEVILDRVDALVIDINTENAFRENSLIWVQGTPSSLNPERPTLIKSVTHNQYPLCYVYRKAGTTMIYAADITNAVGTSETPFVTGVLTGINIDDLLAQWDDEFHTWEAATKTSFEAWMVNQQSVYVTWFDSIKDQMEGDLTDFEAWFETIRGIIDEEAATHLQAEIDVLSEMLPAGSHIDISTSEPTLFNRNVTVSDGVHSKTVQFDASGAATVESFPYIGIIDVSSTDGERIASESLNIPYFGRYSAVLAFWSATVNLMGDESLAALPVTVRDSNGDVIAVITLNASGQGVFTATKPDTYKFIYTYGGQTMEVSLAVTQETTYEVEIHGGFRFDQWLIAGRVEEEFDTLDEILADELTLRQLFLVHDSVDYICDSFTAGSLADVTKIFNTDLAAKWINLSDYALDHFEAIPGIKSIMDTADKYGYGEWVRETPFPLIPTMTSNTEPSGTCFSYGAAGDWADAYKAFDNNASTYFQSNSSTSNTGYLGYDFGVEKTIEYFDAVIKSNVPSYSATIQLQSSNDNTNWTTILTRSVSISANGGEATISGKFDSAVTARYFRLNRTVGNDRFRVVSFQLYEYVYAPKGSVPVMTANNAPYGSASASSAQSGYEAYKAFDNNPSTNWRSSNTSVGNTYHIVYQFVNPVCLKRVMINKVSANDNDAFVVEGSNDGTNYTQISSGTSTADGLNHYYDIGNNDNYYLYARVKFTASVVSDGHISALQFYGRELKVSVPTMTSNTAPFGVASATTETSGHYIWHAFDKSTSTEWNSTALTNQRIAYDFGNKIVPKFATVKAHYYSSLSRLKTFIVQGSNTGGSDDWNDLTEEMIYPNSDTQVSVPLDTTETYRYIALFCKDEYATGTAYIAIKELNFYGLDYSEKEFEAGTTKKWLYDHGVELEPVSVSSSTTSTSKTEKRSSELYVKCLNANSTRARFKFNTFDMSDYSLLRFKVGSEAYASSTVSRGSVRIFDSAESTSIGDSSVSATDSNIPNNKSLDVSTYNQVVTVTLDCSNGVANTQAGITTAERVLTCKELWLE